MRIAYALLGVLLLFANCCLAVDEGIPEDHLDHLKRATVYIQMTTPRGTASGSGFLFKVSGGTGFIVTNQHVIEPNEKFRIPISVVFSSGEGNEKPVAATLLAADADRDLALLSVPLPPNYQPIVRVTTKKIRETMPVYILGFPFGQALAENHGNPSITIGKGSVSSIRKDDFGQVAKIQIDGDVNPGNSGGPIVDTEGNLVGIAVATVLGTNIGFAIPPESLERFFEGRVKTITFQIIENANGQARIKMGVDLIDPLQKLKGVTILWLPAADLAAKPELNRDHEFPAIQGPNLREFKLGMNGSRAEGEFALAGKAGESSTYSFQIRYLLENGHARHTQVSDYRLDFEGRSVAQGQPPKPNQPPQTPPNQEGDWLGGGGQPGSGPQAQADADPVRSGATLLGPLKQVIDAQTAEVKLGGGQILPCIQFSTDGSRAFVLTKEGELRSILTESFTEELKLNIGQLCTWMERSRLGLVVAVAGYQELWIVDELTLKVKRRIPVASVERVATAPTLDVAFATPAGQHIPNMYVVDLNLGRVVDTLRDSQVWEEGQNRIVRHPDGVVLSSFRNITVSPDGVYLYCVGFECLHQFKINRTRLTYEQMGPRIGSNPQRIEISPDSRYVCMPSGGGNGSPKNHPATATPYHTFVYRVGDLQRPVITIDSGNYPRALAFDRVKGMIYGQNHDHSLITFLPSGMRQKEYKLDTRGNETAQIAVHPGGGRLLVLTRSNLYWVAFNGSPFLNAEAPPVVAAAPPEPAAPQPEAPPPRGPVKPPVVGPLAVSKPDKKLPPNMPKPIASARELAGELETEGALLVRPLKLTALVVAPAMLWSADAKQLYLLHQNSLCAIAIPALREERTLTLPSAASWIGRSRSGLAVALPKNKQVWVVQDGALTVQKAIDASINSDDLATHPDLTVAFALGTAERFGQLLVLDLDRGEVAGSYTPVQLAATRPPAADPKDVLPAFKSISRIHVSPNGQYLLFTAENRIWRAKIEGTGLRLQEAGIEVSAEVKDLAFGFGGDTVMALGASNKVLLDTVKPNGPFVYNLFNIENLQAAGMSLSLNAGEALAMAPSIDGAQLYFGGKTHQLVTCDAEGKQLTQAKFTKNGSTLKILPHPDGKHLILHTWDRLLMIRK